MRVIGDLPVSGGVYALILKCGRDATIRAGSRLSVSVRSGEILVYVGSALGPGGLRARVGRHLRRDKRVRWHIDYLTVNDAISIGLVILCPSDTRGGEACIAGECASRLIPGPKGFGSSDDPRNPTHLFRSPAGSVEQTASIVGECFKSCLPGCEPARFYVVGPTRPPRRERPAGEGSGWA